MCSMLVCIVFLVSTIPLVFAYNLPQEHNIHIHEYTPQTHTQLLHESAAPAPAPVPVPVPSPPISNFPAGPIFATNQHGRPLPSLSGSLSVDKGGPISLTDFNFLTLLANFDRERIPERVVYAKGAGAYGYFELTNSDLSNITKASIFNGAEGKQIPLFVRFSIFLGEKGSADTLRAEKGIALKFYTSQGNFDLLGSNIPVSPIRDPLLYPSLVHSRKRHPKTHIHDTNSFWDFITLRPETLHHTIRLFSHLTLMDGYGHSDYYGVNTFKFVNVKGQITYIKFHFETNQGLKPMSREEATKLAGVNPDYLTFDLYNKIQKGHYPSWKVSIQKMTSKQEAQFNYKYKYDPFDPTKIWPEEEFPLIPVGKIVLNKNPIDFFTTVEMAAFDPGNLVEGIELGPDLLLQGRSFSYSDSQRYRLGVNFPQLDVNKPKGLEQHLRTFERDGMCMRTDIENNGDGRFLNYFPNSFGGPLADPLAGDSIFDVAGTVDRYEGNSESGYVSHSTSKDDYSYDYSFEVGNYSEDNISQASDFLEKLTKEQRHVLVGNLAASLKEPEEFIRARVLMLFKDINDVFASEVRDAVNKLIVDVDAVAAEVDYEYSKMDLGE